MKPKRRRVSAMFSAKTAIKRLIQNASNNFDKKTSTLDKSSFEVKKTVIICSFKKMQTNSFQCKL